MPRPTARSLSINADQDLELAGWKYWPVRLAARYCQSPLEWLAVVLSVGLLVAFCPVAMNRAINDTSGTDFPEYYAGGAYVLEHGEIMPGSMAAYYLPSIDVAWAAVALMPLPMASVVWYVFGCVCWAGLLMATYRYLLVDMDLSSRRTGLLTAALVVLPLAIDCLCLGAFHILMLWLMVAGLGRASQGRYTSGGILLGLAVWVKLLPMLGVGYLVAKRKWKAATIAVACAVMVDVTLSVFAYGPTGAWDEHVAWLNRDAAGTTDELLTSEVHVAEQRVTNQSLVAVLRRTLTHLGTPSDSPRDVAAVGYLSGSQLKFVYFGFVGLLVLSIGWFCRKPGDAISPGQWATEIGLVVLSSVWFSPIAPSYHPIAATPALALIVARRAYRTLGWSVFALWLTAMCLHGWPTARAFGHALWTTMAIGAILAWTSRTQPDEGQDILAFPGADAEEIPADRARAA